MRRLLCTAAAAALAAAVVSGIAGASGQWTSYWKTPGEAAYCRVLYGPVHLICWTPNDGFTINLSTTRAPTHFYWGGHKDFYRDVPLLGFGYYWTWGGATFRCDSNSNGLTCRNAASHGFWLGRYHGYRTW